MPRPDHHSRRHPHAPQRQRAAAPPVPLGEDDAVAAFFVRFTMVLGGLVIASGVGLLCTGASARVVLPGTILLASVIMVSSQRLRWTRRVRQVHAAAAARSRW